ncbi:universal stress protein [Streptomyces sp. FXJ1.172]|uniref:universal stress protein n=1 Tax=Streptomyces sp. FXJ1.172 TaxID=710705 RepID=UPI0007D03C89
MSRPGDPRPVVVGVDPDPARRTALAWAADEAVRRRLPLRTVHAEGVPTRGYRRREVPPSWEEWNEALHGAGKQVLEEAAGFVTARHPQLEADVRGRQCHRGPVGATAPGRHPSSHRTCTITIPGAAGKKVP